MRDERHHLVCQNKHWAVRFGHRQRNAKALGLRGEIGGISISLKTAHKMTDDGITGRRRVPHVTSNMAVGY